MKKKLGTKLDYSRTSDSPYTPGSAEDRALSQASADRSKRNRATLAQGAKDVLTGRAALEGAKVLGRFLTSNISRTEKRHMDINGWPKKKPAGFGK